MDIQNLSLKDLKPYPLNAKKHPPEQIEKLVRSINLTGFTQPIVINKEGDELVIIAGHGRYLASLQMNLKTVPCMVLEVPKIVADQARLMDNKSAESDYDIELLIKELSKFNSEEIIETGYDETELNKLILELEETIDELNDESVEVKSFDEKNQDEIPEEKEVETRVKSGDIWQLGNHFILCGDCTIESNIKELLGDKKIDMVFTDPPYGVSYADKNQMLNSLGNGKRNETLIENDNLDTEECKELWINAFKAIGEHLNEYSSYYVASVQMLHLFYEMLNSLKDSGWQIKHLIIWNKNNHVLGRCDYNYKHEPIIYGWKNKHKFYGNGQFKTSVWDIPKPQKSELHPTMKPVELVENCILNSTEEKMIVADCFLGSGTTLIACEKTNRVCFGTELSEKYCDVILSRWEKLTDKTAKFIKNIN
jgi:DNA modification methylase